MKLKLLDSLENKNNRCPDPDCMAFDCNCGLGPCCEEVAYGGECSCVEFKLDEFEE